MGGTKKGGGVGSHHGLSNTAQNKWSDMSFNSANSDKWEFDGSGWLVVEKTIPDANTFYYDLDGTPRSLADWLRKPYRNSTPNATPLKINAPGGLISIPTKDINKPIQSNELLINPTGETTQSPFINIESTPRGVAFTGHLGSYTGEGLESNRPMGLPIALSNTRSPVKQSEGAYHTLSIDIKQKEGKATTPTMIKNQSGADIRKTLPNVEPVVLEQFDIIDNLVMNDRHLLLIHPKQRSRTNTLSTLKSKEDEPTKYHRCNVELMMLRGRVEEIVPTGGEEGEVNGVLLRGRSLVRDIADSVSNRDFNLAEGSPMKEIGDIGSPVVSLTMGGLGQGGIDIKATRKENPHLSGWKDVIMSANNPSVRNDKQTSTYYASTRALVEIPIFPSMFFDTQKRLIGSKNKSSPLPAANALEMVIDATMTAANRPQMQHQESKYAIDWGLDSNISAIRVNDYIAQTNKGIGAFRCFRENAATYTKPSASWSATESTVAAGSANITDWQNGLAYIEVDSVLPFIQEGGQKYTTPTGGGSYPATSPAFQDPLLVAGGMEYNGGDAEWTLTGNPVATPEPDGKGFVVTVGEGILGDWGIRLFIHKVAIVGNSHRLYYGAFHNPLDNTSTPDPAHSNFVGKFISSGLPVVMGGWLTGAAFNHGGNSAWDLESLNIDSGITDALSLVKKLGRCVEMLFGMRLGNDGKARVMLDPKDSNAILIKDGPSMEGMQLDPMHYYYGADDMPLRPPIELIPSYLGLKGKKNDNLTLDHVQKMHINFGDVATNVDDFKQGVSEIIRLINQAAHPNATNTNGGSAFNPPALFSGNYTGSIGDTSFYATTSTDTGSHMGYVRAFEGKEVESRDGESGITIVIHSTIPACFITKLCYMV